MTKSKSENQKTKVTNDSKSKAPTLQILKRSEPNKPVLKKTESETQKPRFQRKEAVCVKSHSKTKGSEPKVWKKKGQDNYSRWSWVKFLKSKDDSYDVFTKFCFQVQSEKELKILKVGTDRGGEFKNEPFEIFCEKFGIVH